MLDITHVNILAVLVAAIVGMAVGFLWYSKLLFSEPWSKLANTKMGENQANPALYVVNLIVYLVIAYALAQLMYYFKLTSLLDGLAAGMFVFVGFSGATAFTENLFSGRRWKLFAINWGYQLVNLMIMGAIIGLWR